MRIKNRWGRKIDPCVTPFEWFWGNSSHYLCTHIYPNLLISYTSVQILHTFWQQSRTYSFSWITNWGSSYSCVITSAKHRSKTFPACFIFIKWSSINYDSRATFAKKAVGRNLTDLSSSSSDWSLVSGKLYRMDVRVARSLQGHSNSALTLIYYYKVNLLLWMLSFYWTMRFIIVWAKSWMFFPNKRNYLSDIHSSVCSYYCFKSITCNWNTDVKHVL